MSVFLGMTSLRVSKLTGTCSSAIKKNYELTMPSRMFPLLPMSLNKFMMNAVVYKIVYSFAV